MKILRKKCNFTYLGLAAALAAWYNGCRTLDDGKRDGKPMNISYQPLWNTLKERGMRKEDLRLAAGLTTNMIANMGKGEHISMKTLLRICEALNCGILDVIELTQDEEN